MAADPGIHPHAIAQRLGLAWGTVSYHLHRLRRAGLVWRVPHGRSNAFFLAGFDDFSACRRRAALRRPRAKAVYETIAGQGRIPMSHLTRIHDISFSALDWHVRQLKSAGLIREDSFDGRRVFLPSWIAPPTRASEAIRVRPVES